MRKELLPTYWRTRPEDTQVSPFFDSTSRPCNGSEGFFRCLTLGDAWY